MLQFKFRKIVVSLIVLSICSAFYYHLYQPLNPKFLINKNNSLNFKPIIFESSIIPQAKFLQTAHSATIVALANEKLIALWFAGTREGAPDVKIYSSFYQSGIWSPAKSIVSPFSLSQQTHSLIRKIGNPVVYLAPNGIMHLFIVSVTIGGWAGSTINHLISNDYGLNWHNAKKLNISPLLNISTLVRTNAISLTDGGFYLPVYQEFIRDYPLLLIFDAQGNFVRELRITNINGMIQPAIAVISPSIAIAYLRNKNYTNQILYAQKTTDGGLHWSQPIATNLYNHDSSIAAYFLSNGLFIMIHNNSNNGTRDKLSLAISYDGIKWHELLDLDNHYNNEFSYPSLAVDNEMINIVYTWQRKKIKYFRISLAWLMQTIKKNKLSA